MANEAGIIKEFLVKLGVVTDAAAIKKFEDGIAQATKVVVGLAVAMEATAIAVGVGVAKFAGHLEDLYFASLRTGTAASSLKAFDRAAMSFGTSAGQAMQSAEGLARFFRNNPGGAAYVNAFLGQIGESAFNANGSVKQTDELLISLGKLFANNTRRGLGFQNTQIAGMLGIDEKTMLAIQSGDFAKKVAEEKQYNQASGLDAAAEGAHRFMESLRKLDDQLYVLGVRIVSVLQQKLGISLDNITAWLAKDGPSIANKVAEFVGGFIDEFGKITKWIKDHPGEIAKRFNEVMSIIEKAYALLRPVVEWLFKKFVDLDTATDGWSTKLIALGLIAKELGLTSIVGGIGALALAFVSLGKGIAGVALGGLGTVLGALVGIPAAAAGGWELGKLINSWFPSIGEHLTGAIESFENGKHPAAAVVNDLMMAGLSHAQAAGVAGNLWQESNFSPSAVNMAGGVEHYGIAQLGPEEQAKYREMMGHDVHDDWNNRTNQINFLVRRLRESPDMRKTWESMKEHMDDTDMNADFNARLFDRGFERLGSYDKEDPRRAGTAINLRHETTINVSGAGDPGRTGQLVADHVDRVNRDNRRVIREFATPGFS